MSDAGGARLFQMCPSNPSLVRSTRTAVLDIAGDFSHGERVLSFFLAMNSVPVFHLCSHTARAELRIQISGRRFIDS